MPGLSLGTFHGNLQVAAGSNQPSQLFGFLFLAIDFEQAVVELNTPWFCMGVKGRKERRFRLPRHDLASAPPASTRLKT